MEVKLSYDIDFSAIIVDEHKIFPNTFKVQINVFTAIDDGYEQNIAFQRILFFIKEMLEKSIFIKNDNPNLSILKDTFKNNHIILLPAEPYDQIIGFILYNKLMAITEDRFELDNIIIGSKEADFIMYTIDDLNDFDLDETTVNWWNNSSLTASNDPKEIESNVSWEDVDLGWDYIDCDECTLNKNENSSEEPEVIFAPEKRINKIFILEGGKSPKEPKNEK